MELMELTLVDSDAHVVNLYPPTAHVCRGSGWWSEIGRKLKVLG